MKFGILGVGKMGSSILEGVIAAKVFDIDNVVIYTPNINHREKYLSIGYNVLNSERELFNNADIILLAIKPQMFDKALASAVDLDFNNKCIISIAAGKTIQEIEKFFQNATVIRAMPNTPSLIQKGCTTICNNNSDDYLLIAKRIFSSIGTVYEIDESQMNETVPLNGSMPAYLYLFAKAFIEHANRMGIDYELSKHLCCDAIIGSAQMIINSQDSIDTLIDNVCSKGGTTIEGLNKLYENSFVNAIEQCFNACVKRAKELRGRSLGLEIVKGSVVYAKCDAIVNAANSGLRAGGGVCGAIFQAAGYRELTRECQEIGGCETGHAVMTKGYKLNAKYIIHAVGPANGDAKLLEEAFYNCLALADSNNLKTIALVPISTGIFGFPLDECARIALKVIKNFKPKSLETCYMYCFNDNEYKVFKDLI